MPHTEIPKKKNLLLISPLLHQGGFERVCVRTARLLAPHYNVTIAIFDDKDIAYDVTGLSVINLHLPARRTFLGKALTLGWRIHALRKLKNQLRIDLSYSFGQTANLANCHARAKDVVFCSVRSFMDFDNPEKIRQFCDKADHIACCSRAIEEKLRTEYACEKTFTLYNPVSVDAGAASLSLRPEDLSLLSPVEEDVLPALSTFLADHPVCIAGMGREDDVKGFWHLLKAFAHGTKRAAFSADKRPGLLILGEGSFQEYKALAKDLGVAQDVFFTGVLRSPWPLLAHCRAFALTSSKEGFPNALVEAMALGVPCVAADCPTGPREILAAEGEPPAGILLPPLSPEKDLRAEHLPAEDVALADALFSLIEDEARAAALSAAGKKRAADFSEAAYVQRCLEIFG